MSPQHHSQNKEKPMPITQAFTLSQFLAVSINNGGEEF